LPLPASPQSWNQSKQTIQNFDSVIYKVYEPTDRMTCVNIAFPFFLLAAGMSVLLAVMQR